MSAHFCSICKHFTSVKKNPCYYEKCGICKIHQDKCFHCGVCNARLDKRLEGNHKCRPDCGHDECCICLRMHSMVVRNYHIHTRPTENVPMITSYNLLNSENKQCYSLATYYYKIALATVVQSCGTAFPQLSGKQHL